MAQDTVDDARFGNKRDDAHARATGAASQGVSLENLLNQPGPDSAPLPGEIRIVPLVGGDADIGFVGSRRHARDSAPVGIGAVEAFTLRVT